MATNSVETTWTINTLINTNYLDSLSGTGTWENPIGGNQYFSDNIIFVATNDKNNNVYYANDTNFKLTVSKNDKINWVVNSMNPINNKNLGVVMYGFDKGANWTGSLTSPSSESIESVSVNLTNGFMSQSKPTGTFIEAKASEIAVPHTSVKIEPVKVTINYHIMILLLDLSSPSKPSIKKYIKIDPKFIIS
ncbi:MULTISPECIES: hypothetical protein [Flavobacterium]|uniref:Inclusion body protein n=1 Tax=Flavobacterium jumunjinense TaxID=998845 RepID=A0ABV5GTZ6_9FLAO|nr:MULTISPECIES: hypothetical protein [Flavobacterium]